MKPINLFVGGPLIRLVAFSFFAARLCHGVMGQSQVSVTDTNLLLTPFYSLVPSANGFAPDDMRHEEIAGQRQISFSGTVTYGSYGTAIIRTIYTNTSPISGLRVMYPMVYGNYTANPPYGGEQQIMGNGWDLMAALEYPIGTTNIVNFTFGGRWLRLVNPNDTVLSDVFGVAMPANTPYAIRTWANRFADSTYTNANGESGNLAADGPSLPNTPMNTRGVLWGSGEGVKFTNTSGINPFTAAINTYFIPTALFTNGTPIPSSDNVAIRPIVLGSVSWRLGTGIVSDGDSWGAGTGDIVNGNAYGGKGWIQTGFGASNIVVLAEGGEKMANWLGGNIKFRGTLINKGHWFLDTLGNNDINQGTNFAQMQAQSIQFWQLLQQNGAGRVIKFTIPPRSTSSGTNFFITIAGQTPSSNNNYSTVRNQYNAWLTNGAPMVLLASTNAFQSWTWTATTNGAPGAITAGAPGHLLWQVVDINPGIEAYTNGVNASVFKPATTNFGLSTTTASTTTTSLCDASASFATTPGLGALVGYTVVTPLGAAQVASVVNATNLTLNTAISGLTSGTSYQFYDIYNQQDGVHPTKAGHDSIATNILYNAVLKP